MRRRQVFAMRTAAAQALQGAQTRQVTAPMRDMPPRVQLQRTSGWQKPAGSVGVARPSRWASPFDWRQHGRLDSVQMFAEALRDGRLAFSEADVRRELRGKVLACWCAAGAPCHADVLLRVANL
jgi:hypothetical protein